MNIHETTFSWTLTKWQVHRFVLMIKWIILCWHSNALLIFKFWNLFWCCIYSPRMCYQVAPDTNNSDSYKFLKHSWLRSARTTLWWWKNPNRANHLPSNTNSPSTVKNVSEIFLPTSAFLPEINVTTEHCQLVSLFFWKWYRSLTHVPNTMCPFLPNFK